MFRTFDVLNGDVPNEETAKTIETVAEASTSDIDLAALVARFNAIDARINKLESQLTDAFKSQITAEQDAVDASSDIADKDNPADDEPTDEVGEKENNDEN